MALIRLSCAYKFTERLVDIAMSLKAFNWFGNYLRGRSQSVQLDDVSSNSLLIQKMVSTRGQFYLLYINDIYININDYINLTKAKCHLCMDDAISYCSTSSLASAREDQQSAFNTIQENLHKLRLVLYSEKTKMMCSSK